MKSKKINLQWVKSVIILIMIIIIYKIMSRLDVYAIACSLLVVVLVLSISYARNQAKKDMEVMRKPKPQPIQFQYIPRQRKKFNALKLEQLRKMNPFAFEEYIAWCYRCLGFVDAHATKATGDGGKDVRFHNAEGTLCYLECKRYNTSLVTRPHVQKLVGAALADQAIPYGIITTGTFTKQAIEEARKTGVKCIGPTELLEMIERAEEIEREKEQVELTELNPPFLKSFSQHDIKKM